MNSVSNCFNLYAPIPRGILFHFRLSDRCTLWQLQYHRTRECYFLPFDLCRCLKLHTWLLTTPQRGNGDLDDLIKAPISVKLILFPLNPSNKAINLYEKMVNFVVFMAALIIYASGRLIG
jgi:hypothetical protein